MKKFLEEFKNFAMKGNVVDLAVGVVIGAAFGKIVSSLVADIIMPLVSLLLGRINISTLKIEIQPLFGGNSIVIKYGNFLQTVIDFLIVAFAIFLVIKLFNKLKKKQEEEPKAPPEPTKQEVLLTEIRDLLKKTSK